MQTLQWETMIQARGNRLLVSQLSVEGRWLSFGLGGQGASLEGRNALNFSFAADATGSLVLWSAGCAL